MTYVQLKARIANWLNRDENAVEDFISLAEDRLRREPRLRELTGQATFTITGDGDELPADFRALDAWYHDSPTARGPVGIVNAEQLAYAKRRAGHTGAPRHAAIIAGKLYYAPEPGGEFETRLSYFRTIPRLSDAEPTNWLLEEHADIYLYAALVEGATFLQEFDALPTWEQQLEQRLEGLHQQQWDAQWSGSLSRSIRAFGR